MGLLAISLLEWSLAIVGLPEQELPLDPYVDLHHLRPLFELNAATRVSDRHRAAAPFHEASFPAKKADGTFRVFALGGSTTQGEPYSTETAFPTWLKLSLEAQRSDQRFEVVNCGGLSYASYRVLAICAKCSYQPT